MPTQRYGPELCQQACGCVPQRTNCRVFNFPATGELLDDQHAIAADLEIDLSAPADRRTRRLGERGNQGAVFRLIVGHALAVRAEIKTYDSRAGLNPINSVAAVPLAGIAK